MYYFDGNSDENRSESDDENLEQVEAGLTQQKMYSALNEDDFDSCWLEAVKSEVKKYAPVTVSTIIV